MYVSTFVVIQPSFTAKSNKGWLGLGLCIRLVGFAIRKNYCQVMVGIGYITARSDEVSRDTYLWRQVRDLENVDPACITAEVAVEMKRLFECTQHRAPHDPDCTTYSLEYWRRRQSRLGTAQRFYCFLVSFRYRFSSLPKTCGRRNWLYLSVFDSHAKQVIEPYAAPAAPPPPVFFCNAAAADKNASARRRRFRGLRSDIVQWRKSTRCIQFLIPKCLTFTVLVTRSLN